MILYVFVVCARILIIYTHTHVLVTYVLKIHVKLCEIPISSVHHGKSSFSGCSWKIAGASKFAFLPLHPCITEPAKAVCCMLYNAIYIYTIPEFTSVSWIYVLILKSRLNVPNNFISYQFPRSGSFSGQGRRPRRQGPGKSVTMACDTVEKRLVPKS